MSSKYEPTIQQIPIPEKMRQFPLADIEAYQQTPKELNSKELETIVGAALNGPVASAFTIGGSVVMGSMAAGSVSQSVGTMVDLAQSRTDNKHANKAAQIGQAVGAPAGLAGGLILMKASAREAANEAAKVRG